MKNLLKNKQGFTIIEVVLVLAIAALIMLMVFIALPALQRSQRDTQRKDDVSRLQAAISSYTSNNRGKSPFGPAADGGSNTETFINNYLRVEGELFQDPQGEDYEFVPKLGAADDAPAGSGQIAVHGGGKCQDGEDAGDSSISGARSGALRIRLESGGVHCIEY